MKSVQKWVALGLAVAVLGSVTAFAVKNNAKTTAAPGGSQTESTPETDSADKGELPMVADAAMYRGTVVGIVAGESGKTLLVLEQAEGTNYGSPTFTVSITENTALDSTVDELVENKAYVEVMYGVSGGAGKPVEDENNVPPEAITVKLLSPAQFAVFNGEVVSVEGADAGAKTVMSIMLKPLGGGEEVLFHVAEDTQIYMNVADIKPGAKLNLLERGVRTMSIPAQGAALEIRPYYDPLTDADAMLSVE